MNTKIICSTLCYVRKYGKTLMLHRVKRKNDMHQGKWNGLGGKMEFGETPEECVIREVKEESGLLIRNPVMKGVLTFPAFDDVSDWIVFLFVANRFSGIPVESDEGELSWIPNRLLTRLSLWEGDKFFLKWLDNKSFFSAKFIYRHGRYKSHQVHFY